MLLPASRTPRRACQLSAAAFKPNAPSFKLSALLLCLGAVSCRPAKSPPASEPPPSATATTAPSAPGAAPVAAPLASPGDPSAPLAEADRIEPVPPPDYCANSGSKGVATGQAELVRDGFVFLEGPVWVNSLGALLFSEMDFNQNGDNGPPSTVHRLTPPSSFDVFLPNSGSNGLALGDQKLLMCAHDDQSVSEVDLQTKARTQRIGEVEGRHFNSPNDITRRSTGQIYFTDPDWQLGRRTKETGITGVYFSDPEGQATLFDASLDKPNGIALSPDQRTLYVGAVDGVVYRYELGRDGAPRAKTKHAEVKEPDGMAVDCAGNLYVTSHGPGEVKILSPEGKALGTIAVAPRATNAAFGGADRKTLYVTAGGGLYRIDSPLPGFPY